ncbi:MAG: hypothetical protein HY053_07290, partial [Proteobacteria bacterium]|nr:hypothetical protein [Pseudomonadota bacterium]
MTTNFYLLCPLIAALGWGLLYAVEGKIYRFVSIPTNFLVFAASNVFSALLLAYCFKMPIDFSPYLTHPQRLLAWLVLPFAMIGTIFLHLTIK